MSKAYREEFEIENPKKTSDEMRLYCQRPGKMDQDGNPIYFTEQNHKKECDVNEIIKKYDRTGLITHVSKIEAKFGDLTGADFKAMQDQVANAHSMFAALPAEIRKFFENEPSKLLEFMEDSGNRDQAIKMGLIDATWDESQDGFGEHVIRDPVTLDEDPEPKK